MERDSKKGSTLSSRCFHWLPLFFSSSVPLDKSAVKARNSEKSITLF